MHREQMLEMAKGLREAADWIEANADLPGATQLTQVRLNVQTREQISAIARRMGTFDKLDKNDCWSAEFDYIIAKSFGPVRIQAHCDRGKICKKVKVMREVEEYECSDSILAPELPAEAAAE